ncbi:MAG: hypothetical protein J6K53_11780 [Roseburia sp.]|nr:hypothetical protein [Roseburia sp.]
MDRIFISYSSTENVTYCFWKYFFEACGVWVSAQEIEHDWQRLSTEEPCLFILGSEDVKQLLPDIFPNYFYLVKKNKTFDSFVKKKRKDVAQVQRWDEAGEGFGKVIDYLVPVHYEKQQFRKFLDIFMRNRMWSASWLFHEVAQQGKGRWDGMISDICQSTLADLKQMPQSKGGNDKKGHILFIRLYCKYVDAGVRDRSFMSRITAVEELMVEWQELVRCCGRTPSVYVLAGKISTMSPIESKYAPEYYKEATEYEERPEILYDIGHIYEKVYGDNERALKYYKKAYDCDRRYYRAIYKLAVSLELRGKWMEALVGYGKIMNILDGRTGDSRISIREIEYEYKTCKKMRELYRSNIDSEELIKRYDVKLNDLYEGLKTRKDFDKLVHCMLPKNEEVRDEIIEEILEKFNVICC